MIVIIEGCDRTGKSTLAKKIAETIGAEVIHCGKPKTDNPFQEYLEQLVQLDPLKHHVFDRFYLGEYVYSTLWRGGCKITSGQFKLLDMVAAGLHKAIVIHANADINTIIERCKKDGEDLLKPEQIEKCVDLFNQIIYHTNLPVITYDSDVSQPLEIASIVKAYTL
jgi:thymidylate kinase